MLLIDIPQSNGTTASYWSILSIGIDYVSRCTTVNLGGYLDQVSFDKGCTPLAFQTLYFTGDSFFDDPTRDTVYQELQSTPTYAQATLAPVSDVLTSKIVP